VAVGEGGAEGGIVPAGVARQTQLAGLAVGPLPLCQQVRHFATFALSATQSSMSPFRIADSQGSSRWLFAVSQVAASSDAPVLACTLPRCPRTIHHPTVAYISMWQPEGHDTHVEPLPDGRPSQEVKLSGTFTSSQLSCHTSYSARQV